LRHRQTYLMMTGPGSPVAVPLADVRQVVGSLRPIRVPMTLPGVEGVVAVDGRAIPVYRMGELALPGCRPGPPGEGRVAAGGEIVIIEEDGAMAGFLVERTDAVSEIRAGSALLLDGHALLTAAGAIEPGEGEIRTARAVQGEKLES